MSGNQLDVDQVRARIVDLSHEQSAVLEGASSAVNGMQRFLTEQEERLDHALDALAQARDGTALGRSDVESLAASLDDLQVLITEVRSAVDVIARVNERTDAIREIITDIRMLGLNAAIEAARAGEKGQGFAVVASSMRELARSGGFVADEITQVVSEGMEQVSSLSGTVQARLEAQSERVRSVIEAFDRIEGSVTGLDDDFATIARAMRSNRAQAGEVNAELQRHMELASGHTARIVGLLTGVEVCDLDPPTANRRLGQFVIVDVRRPDEWSGELGRLDGAVHIPIASDDFRRRLARCEREAATLFVCRSGGRSARAARVAIELGFKEVYNLEGGMLAWTARKLPTVSGRSRAA